MKKIIIGFVTILIVNFVFISVAFAQIEPNNSQSPQPIGTNSIQPSPSPSFSQPTGTSPLPSNSNSPLPQQSQNVSPSPSKSPVSSDSDSLVVNIAKKINAILVIPEDILVFLVSNISFITEKNVLVVQFYFYMIFMLFLVGTIAFEIYNWIKKIKPWGTIYDSKSKQPVGLATVRLFSAEEKKLLQTVVTDQEGRYNFLVQPGNYYIEVIKEGFHFPSRIITSDNDGQYTNLYKGENISINKENAFLSSNIAVDSSKEVVAKKFSLSFIMIVNYLRLPLLVATTIIDNH